MKDGGALGALEQYQRRFKLDSAHCGMSRRYSGERRLAGRRSGRFGLGFARSMATGWCSSNRAGANLALTWSKLAFTVFPSRRNREQQSLLRIGCSSRSHPRGVRWALAEASCRALLRRAEKLSKYYNSSDTELFSKSEQLYGIDLARQAGAKAGYLAVVEGYTDVLMAHQCGVGQVVATMGTALNARHVQQLRRFAERVILVFDADEGGDTGVDRALEVFASQEVDLKIAMLPAGQDPCDLLVEKGAEPFVQALECAVDALEFKLNQVLKPGEARGVEERMAGMDSVLRIIALVDARVDRSRQT